MIDRERLRRDAREFGIELSDGMLEQFERYINLLLRVNKRINLTAITDPREIEVKHLLDSLLLLKAAELPREARVIDVGSGAGFPGIPLKIVRPDLNLTIVDSVGKKVIFLKEASTALGQDNDCVHARVEDLARTQKYRERYDVAVARAVAALPVLCEYCLPFVKQGGIFLSMKGLMMEEELEQAGNAIKVLGGAMGRVEKIKLPLGIGRSVIAIEKRSQTQTKYPRKTHQIAKQPL